MGRGLRISLKATLFQGGRTSRTCRLRRGRPGSLIKSWLRPYSRRPHSIPTERCKAVEQLQEIRAGKSRGGCARTCVFSRRHKREGPVLGAGRVVPHAV